MQNISKVLNSMINSLVMEIPRAMIKLKCGKQRNLPSGNDIQNEA